ncbi:tyrosine-protein phosphatase [Holzapfeliella sp. He02]|uniref:Tyrosine-protein phosphatase n=1 Tax=Holzapfeliella saturejae TaxID=3082953 RepID=A0ABU8SF82_9LACO
MAYNMIGVKNGSNFRELTGYKNKDGLTIKPNKLLRSGHLGDLSDADMKVLKDHGLTYDMDFRSQEEITAVPDRVPEGVEYVWNPVFSQDLTDNSKSATELADETTDDPKFGFNRMIYAYHDIVLGEKAQKAYRKFFDYLLKNDQDNEALLFHCTAGKDRTGMAGVFLMHALGMDYETIKEDYLLTNQASKPYIDNRLGLVEEKGGDPVTYQAVKDLVSVQEGYINYALELMDKDFGGIDNYLKDILGVTDDKIKKLREIYLH